MNCIDCTDTNFHHNPLQSIAEKNEMTHDTEITKK